MYLFIQFKTDSIKSTAEALNGKTPHVHIVTAKTVENKANQNQTFDDICLTPGCVHAASKMLEHLDETIEPCDDFYEFR